MPNTGKIITLFEDSSKEKALYPRTKISAVSDGDGNTLGNVSLFNSDIISDASSTTNLIPKFINVFSGSTTPSSDLGNDGDIYIITE